MYFSRSLAISAVVLSITLPVKAQDLAQEVILEYFETLEDLGLTVTFDQQSVVGNGVEWTGVTMTNTSKTGDTMTGQVASILATELAGVVSVAVSPEVQYVVTSSSMPEPLKITATHENFKWLISGPKGARNYNYAALNLNLVTSGGTEGADFTINATGLSGEQSYTGTDIKNGKGFAQIDDVKVDFTIDDKETKGVGDYRIQDLEVKYDVDAVTEETANEYFDGTRGFSFDYSASQADMNLDVSGPDFVGKLLSKSGGGNGAMSLKGGEFRVLGISESLSYELDASAMGMLPFTASMGQSMMDFAFPMKKQDTPTPVKLILGVNELKVSDSLWGMFDPMGNLSRDPASLKLDLSAMMRWLVDPATADDSKEVPVEFTSVALNELSLDAVGAKLTGKGAVDLNNAGPIPEPIGKINLDLKGGFALLDSLIKMGIVPQEQGMMVRMMSGMFTDKGPDGPDHLISEVEAQAGGAILINGQRIK